MSPPRWRRWAADICSHELQCHFHGLDSVEAFISRCAKSISISRSRAGARDLSRRPAPEEGGGARAGLRRRSGLWMRSSLPGVSASTAAAPPAAAAAAAAAAAVTIGTESDAEEDGSKTRWALERQQRIPEGHGEGHQLVDMGRATGGHWGGSLERSWLTAGRRNLARKVANGHRLGWRALHAHDAEAARVHSSGCGSKDTKVLTASRTRRCSPLACPLVDTGRGTEGVPDSGCGSTAALGEGPK